MARLDVYANPDTAERRHTPYLVDVQNDCIDHIEARVVIPLRRETAFGPQASNLNPLRQVAGKPAALHTEAIGAVPRAELRKRMGELRNPRAEIREALDPLFGTF